MNIANILYNIQCNIIEGNTKQKRSFIQFSIYFYHYLHMNKQKLFDLENYVTKVRQLNIAFTIAFTGYLQGLKN